MRETAHSDFVQSMHFSTVKFLLHWCKVLCVESLTSRAALLQRMQCTFSLRPGLISTHVIVTVSTLRWCRQFEACQVAGIACCFAATNAEYLFLTT
jgi:hypothetical protein